MTASNVIARKLDGREEDFAELFVRMDSDDADISEDAQVQMDEMPLSVETKTVVKVLFSWGGPSDWLEITMDPQSREVETVVYGYAEWFDVARTTVEEGTALWRYAEWIAEVA